MKIIEFLPRPLEVVEVRNAVMLERVCVGRAYTHQILKHRDSELSSGGQAYRPGLQRQALFGGSRLSKGRV